MILVLKKLFKKENVGRVKLNRHFLLNNDNYDLG
jgi:hypothetical protein